MHKPPSPLPLLLPLELALPLLSLVLLVKLPPKYLPIMPKMPIQLIETLRRPNSRISWHR